MNWKYVKSLIVIGVAISVIGCGSRDGGGASRAESETNRTLSQVLRQQGFTGTMQASLPTRLKRPINAALADVGRLIFHDNIVGLHKDNSCAGCHSAAAGWGDTQSIAIGTDSNGIVGPGRAGPRNQRRAPQAANSAFYPAMMLNLRFASISQDPFDLSLGARVPFGVGGTTVWRPGSLCAPGTCFEPDKMTTLLSVQGHLPPTETVEMAGFSTANESDADPRLYHPAHIVSSGEMADTVPGPGAGPNGAPGDSIDSSYAIRAQLLDRFNAIPGYVDRFAAIYPEAAGGNITFAMIAAALAEFQISTTFADAPLDKFARGDTSAMTLQQKRGALLFFGKANCVTCHAVAGKSNEMFSDFENHVAGIPQIAPAGFGLRAGGDPLNPADFPGNFEFSGPNTDEDFGLQDFSGDPLDRYKFRTSPLRNLAVQPAFFHNGAFTRLDRALRYHLNTAALAPTYDPAAEGLDADLTMRRGPMEPVLRLLDPALIATAQNPLTAEEFDDLLAFLRDGLLDARILPAQQCLQVPATVPSGIRVQMFQGC